MSDLSIISGMFEELKQILKNRNKNTQENGIHIPHLANTEKNIIYRVSQSEELILSKLERIKQTQAAPKKLYHKTSVDIKSSWVCFTLFGLSFFLITTLCLCYKLEQANNRLTDNDIKYRYTKMYNKADSIMIYQLEDIFIYNRNVEVINKIKSDVQEYENAIYKSA